MLDGVSDWRNIQFIRSTFKALHDVIRSQSDALRSLERQMESKVSADDFQSALSRKANIVDVNRSLTDVSAVLESKAERAELANALRAKADRSDLDSVKQQADGKVASLSAAVAAKPDRVELVAAAAAASEAIAAAAELRRTVDSDRAGSENAVRESRKRLDEMKDAVDQLDAASQRRAEPERQRVEGLEKEVQQLSRLQAELAQKLEVCGAQVQRAQAEARAASTLGLVRKADRCDLEALRNAVDDLAATVAPSSTGGAAALLRSPAPSSTAPGGVGGATTLGLRDTGLALLGARSGRREAEAAVAAADSRRAEEALLFAHEALVRETAAQRSSQVDVTAWVEGRLAAAEAAAQAAAAALVHSLQADLLARIDMVGKELRQRIADQDAHLTRLVDDDLAPINKALASLSDHIRVVQEEGALAMQRMELQFHADLKRKVDRAVELELESVHHLISQTARRDDIVKALAAKLERQDFEGAVEELKTFTLRAVAGKAEEKQVSEGLLDVRSLCQKRASAGKAEREELERALADLRSTVAQVDRIKVERQYVDHAVQSLQNAVNKGVAEGLEDVRKEMGRQLEAHHADVRKEMGRQFEACLADARAIRGVSLRAAQGARVEGEQRAEEEQRACIKTVNDRLDVCAGQVEACRRELQGEVRGLAAEIGRKADADELQRTLTLVHGQLAAKASSSELTQALREVSELSSSLSSELCLGRWIWRTGKTKPGGAVPWNVQAANADPQNLVWERDKASITCVQPGLYEVQLGFFSRKRPVVKLTVNGDSVMTVANNSASVFHTPGASRLTPARPLMGSITGLTHIDFLALPPRAKVALLYQGDDDAEAFLGLRRL